MAGLISLERLQHFVTLALNAERAEREVDYMQTLSLPFPWTIRDAMEARAS